ncbi:hypothetical protein SAMN04488085_101226 [Geodermatophilus ruber]|uniref:Uncharacterized protein n=1 Tax=Geodermatophilus ruber TaxID=504800 RepID=A0A1I3YVV4_9ACTN|nr:hypothetical protein SAMN04488085_101226 [Geodermatophilus ruber]
MLPRGAFLATAAAAAVAIALLVLLPEALGEPGRVAAVAVLQLALVAAWVPATGVLAGRGALVLGVAAAAGADVLMVLPERPEIGALLAVPGLGFLAAVLHQMLRPAPRREVVGSLAGIVLLICGVSALAVLLLLGSAGDDGAATTALLVVGATVVVGRLVDAGLPRPAVVPGLVAGVLAGVVVAVARQGSGAPAEILPGLLSGLVLAAVAALIGLAAGYIAAEGARSAWATPLLQAVLPVAACAPVIFSLLLQNAL